MQRTYMSSGLYVEQVLVNHSTVLLPPCQIAHHPTSGGSNQARQGHDHFQESSGLCRLIVHHALLLHHLNAQAALRIPAAVLRRQQVLWGGEGWESCRAVSCARPHDSGAQAPPCMGIQPTCPSHTTRPLRILNSEQARTLNISTSARQSSGLKVGLGDSI